MYLDIPGITLASSSTVAIQLRQEYGRLLAIQGRLTCPDSDLIDYCLDRLLEINRLPPGHAALPIRYHIELRLLKDGLLYHKM